MGDKQSLEDQYKKAKADLSTVSSKLEAIRAEINAKESAHNDLSNTATQLGADLTYVTEQFDALKGQSDEKIAALYEQVSQIDAYSERAVKAEEKAAFEANRADEAEALVIASKAHDQDTIRTLDAEARVLRGTLARVRDAVKTTNE